MLLTHLVLFSFLGGASASDAAPADTPSGGWFRKPKSHFRAETKTDREARIKAERIRMGILPPDPAPDVQPEPLGLSTTLSTMGAGSGINSDTTGGIKAAPYPQLPLGLAAHLLPEDLAGLEALAARAAQLAIDAEIALWLRLAEQRRLHAEWLRDEDDAAVLLLAIATIH